MDTLKPLDTGGRYRYSLEHTKGHSMGMSTHAVGFRPPDETWMKHKVVWDACKAAGVPVPRATCTFFGDVEPDPSGVVVEIQGTPAVRKWRDEGREGFEIELSKLPEGIKIVRVYNAW